jgi:hypothetical protein
MLGELRVDQRAITEQQEFSVGMPSQRNRGAGNDDGCADIATHGVKRDSNLLRHERPGNLISCSHQALGCGLKDRRWRAAIGEARRYAPAGRGQ